MDARAVLDLAVGVAAVGAWSGGYGVARLVTRPAVPQPDPATPDLGDEPPAVVSLLVNRWRLTEDAAEATLLDLAARGFVELRQPGDDPRQTTIHLPPAPPGEALLPYEREVLSRVHRLAVGGVLPLTALTFRDHGEAKSWNKRLRGQVVAGARAAGLSRPRFGPAVTGALVAAAAVAAVAVGLAALHYGVWSDAEDNPGPWAGFATFAVLLAIAGRSPGERDTRLGREVAARWLGVRDWLRGHEQFGELPPASVTVWDRYLGYGAAVGATHLASTVLDLGMGDRRLVWSSYGGTWHRVRVRYPRFWPRYGRPLPILLLRAAIGIAAGTVLSRTVAGPSELTPVDSPIAAVAAIALCVLAAGGYSLARAVADAFTVRTVTGEVLWQEVWRSRQKKNDKPAVPWLYYLAVDDGTGERTTAWGLPSELYRRFGERDTVTIRVRPWSRRIIEVAPVTEPSRGAVQFLTQHT